jgi:hypothetical protein
MSTRGAWRCVAWGVLWLVASGCDRGQPSERAAQPASIGLAIAHVNGEAIGLSEVQRLCDATGLGPREALERLIAERLLSQHAAEQGYGQRATVEQGVQQARVRALLEREIETHPPPRERASEPDAADASAAARAKLDGLLRELAAKTPIHYDQAAIEQAFAEPTPP